MFRYIPKSIWFPTSVDEKQVPTIEELIKLCKAGEVERVIIPMTYYGYGSTLVDDSNRRSIKKHYAQNRFKDYGYNLTMSSYQFLKHEEFRELVRALVEDYIVFNEQDYSELEYETKLEEVVSSIEFYLDKHDLFIGGNDGACWTKHYIKEVLEFRPGNAEDDITVDWIDYVEIDMDGYTVYIKETDLERIALEVQEFSVKMWGKKK